MRVSILIELRDTRPPRVLIYHPVCHTILPFSRFSCRNVLCIPDTASLFERRLADHDNSTALTTERARDHEPTACDEE